MERIPEVSIVEKMSILSGLTTLTIDIQKVLQSWTYFQHHLAITTPAIVGFQTKGVTNMELGG